ncbi:MAG: methylmalonyl Co-A mutase-associated GTPase MeaB, partial [Burkholderiales bacterium]|nr:methylmalonyl Co-A mutase-associated GTPase MeaB [Burkholderiales bacterium]
INKADLDEHAAIRARAQITSSLRIYGHHGHPDHAAHDDTLWQPAVLRMSALKSTGIAEFWQTVQRYRALQTASGRLAARRHAQDEAWMWERIESGLHQRFRQHPPVRDALRSTTDAVRAGQLAASVAARRLLDLFKLT